MNRNTKVSETAFISRTGIRNETADMSKTGIMSETADRNKNTSTGKKSRTSRQMINIILMTALAAAFISGSLIRPLGDSVIMLAVHKLSSLILVICSIFHVLQYRKKKEVTHVS